MMGAFAEVHAGEGPTAALLALNVFLLLASYYIMKPVREALILAGGGAELKAYMSAGQTVLMLFTVPLGIAFYLWVGVFNVSVIAQFWSFANDLYTPEQGKRLFAIVAFGASAGAVVGPMIARWLIEPMGAYQLLLVAAAVLAVSLLVTNYIDLRERRRDRPNSQATSKEEPPEPPMGKTSAYRLVFGNRYLLLIAILILFLNWVNTTGESVVSNVFDLHKELTHLLQ